MLTACPVAVSLLERPLEINTRWMLAVRHLSSYMVCPAQRLYSTNHEDKRSKYHEDMLQDSPCSYASICVWLGHLVDHQDPN